MFHYEPVRPFDDRPSDYLETGHFWLREFVTGGVFAFTMESSGLLSMRGPTGEFETEVPWPYQRAVDAIRDRFERDRFRAEVDSVSEYDFFVLAALSQGVGYDWTEIPPVFGLAIWDDTANSFVSIDVAERVFEAVGLWTIPTVDREVPARELGAGPELIPKSAFADGPAAGIVLLKKRGAAVSILGAGFDSVTRVPPAPAGSPDDFESWLQETLREDSVAPLLSEPDRPIDAWAIESLTTEVSAELARQEFDTIGAIAQSRPKQFRKGISDRLVELREFSVS
jgi:hypothetical protein